MPCCGLINLMLLGLLPILAWAVIEDQHSIPTRKPAHHSWIFLSNIFWYAFFCSSHIKVPQVRTLSVNMMFVIQEAPTYTGSSPVDHSCDCHQILLTRHLKPSESEGLGCEMNWQYNLWNMKWDQPFNVDFCNVSTCSSNWGCSTEETLATPSAIVSMLWVSCGSTGSCWWRWSVVEVVGGGWPSITGRWPSVQKSVIRQSNFKVLVIYNSLCVGPPSQPGMLASLILVI